LQIPAIDSFCRLATSVETENVSLEDPAILAQAVIRVAIMTGYEG